MARSDPDKLAQALRANLRRRKDQSRAAQDGEAKPMLGGHEDPVVGSEKR